MDDVAAFGDDAANDGLDIAECRLPESGKVYRARQTRDDDIGYDLINRVRPMLIRWMPDYRRS